MRNFPGLRPLFSYLLPACLTLAAAACTLYSHNTARQAAKNQTPRTASPPREHWWLLNARSSSADCRGKMAASAENFDPTLIVLQMIALQCFYYLAIGIFYGVCHMLFGTVVSLDHFFSAAHLTASSAAGWLEITAVIASAFAGRVVRPLVCDSVPFVVGVDSARARDAICRACATIESARPGWWVGAERSLRLDRTTEEPRRVSCAARALLGAQLARRAAACARIPSLRRRLSPLALVPPPPRARGSGRCCSRSSSRSARSASTLRSPCSSSTCSRARATGCDDASRGQRREGNLRRGGSAAKETCAGRALPHLTKRGNGGAGSRGAGGAGGRPWRIAEGRAVRASAPSVMRSRARSWAWRAEPAGRKSDLRHAAATQPHDVRGDATRALHVGVVDGAPPS